MGVLWFILGAILGSAANAIIYRLPLNLSWTRGRSICPQCKHRLSWYDLIPLVSFLTLSGKCRYCHKPIGLRYPLVELLVGLGFAYFQSPLLAGLVLITVIVAAMDWESMLVSDWLIGIWATLVILSGPISLPGLVIGVVGIGAIWAISKGRAMGFGDVEIAAVMGLWLGWPRIGYAFWFAFVIGALVGVALLVKGKKKMKSQLAFGPFLIVGTWLSYLIQWSNVLPF